MFIYHGTPDGINSKCQLRINQNETFQFEMKPQHCLTLLHLVWLDTISVLCALLESINQMLLELTRDIEGYGKLRKLLRHSRLDSHVDQTRYTATDRQSRQ